MRSPSWSSMHQPKAELRSSEHSVVNRLAVFSGALRGAGMRVGLVDEVDAATALTLADLLDRAEVHRVLRIALKVPRESWATFDRLFEEYWDGKAAPERRAPRQTLQGDHRGPAAWQWDGERVRLELPGHEEAPEGGTPGYSAEAM